VRVSGVHGSRPPEQLKVCVNELGGHRNQVEFVLTGLDIDEKAAWVRTQLEARIAGNPPADVSWSLGSRPAPDPDTEEAASCLLRVVVKDPSADVVGKAFSAAAVELALASYPGFTMTSPPGRGSPYGVYRPTYVDRSAVEETVHLWDGRTFTIGPPPETGPADAPLVGTPAPATPEDSPTVCKPLGTFVHARSGDKGGDANVGLWVGGTRDELRDRRVAWLLHLITPDHVRQLMPEAKDLDVEVFALPNLGGVNVLVRDLLGDGVAASTRFDPQAKAVGEWLRSRHVHIPEELL
jgi:hypothetical protein